jgi:hypothetical protein
MFFFHLQMLPIIIIIAMAASLGAKIGMFAYSFGPSD